MRQRASSTEHHDTVTRRLARLSEELAPQQGRLQETHDPVEPIPAAAGDEWWAEATRVAPARRALAVVPAVVPDPEPARPTEFAAPGRHAARRPGRLAEVLPASLPATLRGSGSLTPTHLTLVAVLVALGLAITMWWVIRSDPGPPTAARPATRAEPAAELVAPASNAPQSQSGAAAAKVTVDVAGRVRRPGIVVLPDGARVVDALERAGGARSGVDLTTVNLARKLVDGEQILVGLPGVAAAAPPAPGGSGGVPAPLVDLNLASQTELETLPDVGPVTAAAIIGWRDEHGGFSAVTELIEVDGIGQVTLEKLTPLVTV